MRDSAMRMRKLRTRKSKELPKIEEGQLDLIGDKPSHSDVDLDTEIQKRREESISSPPDGVLRISFLRTLDPKDQVTMLATENKSIRTIDEVLDYIPIYESKTGKIIKDKSAFIYKALTEEWDLSGESYEQWGGK